MTDEQHEILIRIDERVSVLVISTVDQEKRLRALERFRNWSAGLGASVVSAFGLYHQQ